MISQEHHKKCSNLLRQLVKKHAATYKEVIESYRYEAEASGIRYDAYKDEFDPDSYRKILLEQEILPSDDFVVLYNELTGERHIDNFYLFGKSFHIHIKGRLIRIVNLSLMMYEHTLTVYEVIQEEFDDLYFSLYEDKFTVKIVTLMKNLSSVETELLNQEELSVNVQRNPKTSNTYIVYNITDSKKIENYKINPMQYPQTIINIASGILAIYKSPEIHYVLTDVTYSLGCPKFIELESSLFPISTTNDYVINNDELGRFKDFFQKAFLSEEKIMLAIERFSIACERESDYESLGFSFYFRDFTWSRRR